MDTATLEALKRGDATAWETLILEHQDRILNYLFHLEGGYQDALDLTQETFMRAWRGIGTFRAGEAVTPWLYAIARNVQCEKHRRKMHAQFSLEEASETGFDPKSHAATPQQHAEQQQSAERVQVALTTLPEEYRSAVVLRFMEDLSYEEIANIQGVALGTAKSRVFRGKELLARALQGRVLFE